MSLTLEELSKRVLQQAQEKGFGTRPEEISVPEKIALIHSEISEAYEAWRQNRTKGKDSVTEELGDAVQRILHLAAVLGIDLEKAMLDKLAANKTRQWDWDKMNEKHV